MNDLQWLGEKGTPDISSLYKEQHMQLFYVTPTHKIGEKVILESGDIYGRIIQTTREGLLQLRDAIIHMLESEQ